jgi:hypothetical protein
VCCLLLGSKSKPQFPFGGGVTSPGVTEFVSALAAEFAVLGLMRIIFFAHIMYVFQGFIVDKYFRSNNREGAGLNSGSFPAFLITSILHSS